MSRRRPDGAVVSISYDGAQLAPGDGLRTATGRTYIVIAVRLQARGVNRGRQHLRCIVGGEPLAPARLFPLFWYKRERKERS